ncbi:hypothetical protein LEP1GSC132_3334 [Leptospira kirschneri str. 200803703]|nr:hypothetical protein LEP1GSC132_3334 [Leptospira kirschneri str. 200803703]
MFLQNSPTLLITIYNKVPNILHGISVCDKINDTQFYKKSVIFSFLVLFHKFEKKL